MAIPTFNAIGFCAHYSKQGDWAFDYALELSESSGIKLNVFHFLNGPYGPLDNTAGGLTKEEREQLAIDKEKELRLYYDKRAREYLDVGFRVCYDESWAELHRCLLIREFQLLILGVPVKGVYFAGKPIEKFAESFVSPVILIGPDSPAQFYLNSQAALLIDMLDLEDKRYEQLKMQTA